MDAQQKLQQVKHEALLRGETVSSNLHYHYYGGNWLDCLSTACRSYDLVGTDDSYFVSDAAW